MKSSNSIANSTLADSGTVPALSLSLSTEPFPDPRGPAVSGTVDSRHASPRRALPATSRRYVATYSAALQSRPPFSPARSLASLKSGAVCRLTRSALGLGQPRATLGTPHFPTHPHTHPLSLFTHTYLQPTTQGGPYLLTDLSVCSRERAVLCAMSACNV